MYTNSHVQFKVRGVFVHVHKCTRNLDDDTCDFHCYIPWTVHGKYIQAHLHTAYRHACQGCLDSPATTSGH